MNPKLKAFLVISLKQAAMAVLGNGGLSLALPGVFHFHSWVGILAILKATGAMILAREGVVWGPILWKWANSPTPGENGILADKPTVKP